MTIQSINAYTPSRGADPKLDRKWATKVELYTGVVALEKHLTEQIQELRDEISLLKEKLNNESSNNN